MIKKLIALQPYLQYQQVVLPLSLHVLTLQWYEYHYLQFCHIGRTTDNFQRHSCLSRIQLSGLP